jgi:hypothetical protein
VEDGKEIGMINHRQRAWDRTNSVNKTYFSIGLLPGSMVFAFFRLPNSFVYPEPRALSLNPNNDLPVFECLGSRSPARINSNNH